MIKKTTSLFVLLVFAICSYGQQNVKADYSNPKLVIGIVVDQMRYDYLTRFYNKYGDGGFIILVLTRHIST